MSALRYTTFYRNTFVRRTGFLQTLTTQSTLIAGSTVAWTVGFTVNGYLLNLFDGVTSFPGVQALESQVEQLQQACEAMKPPSELSQTVNQSLDTLRNQCANSSVLTQISPPSLPTTFFRSLGISVTSVAVVIFQLFAFVAGKASYHHYQSEFVKTRVIGECKRKWLL